MKLSWTLTVAFFAQGSVFAARPTKRSYETHDYYVIEHDPYSGASLAQVASVLEVEIVEQAGELENHWLVRRTKPDLTSLSNESDPVMRMFNDLRRRQSIPPRSQDDLAVRAVSSSLKYLAPQTLRQRVKRAPPPIPPPVSSSLQSAAAHFGIVDPLFPEQWHIINEDYPEHMHNITPVWEMGITGKGVISSLVDDGLDYDSDDLKDNFDKDNSYDFNDHEDLPTPKKFDDHHGTRCAGQVAAVKNTACGIGIAYNSKVAGVRILSGPISDVDEAAALNYGYQNVSIYSCSWGPPDNGQAMEGPGYLIKKAVVNGINKGRGGKGSIFVFASGNGAANGDQCNFDGYTNSIYSVTVSAIDYKGLHPYYSEPCAANMVVAYSSGSGKHIVTTDKGGCTKSHGGTSAAAPNAVGVFALALEVRSDLTWRDIQYLCIESARMINLNDPDWEKTAAGKLYSYKYGYGVLDASRYIAAAKSWKLVKPQAWFETPAIQLDNGTMLSDGKYSGGTPIPKDGIKSTMTITRQILQENNFESLEHINVRVWIQHSVRGDVEVEIVSPKGVRSVLASQRRGDRENSGYPGWQFMSVKHWGEDPVGDWTVKVSDQGPSPESNGSFLGWNMMFWGTTIDPSKAKKFDLPLVDNVLPVHIDPPVVVTPTTTTKVHPKPTDHLPDDHGHAPGENTKPAFTSTSQAGSTATSSPTPTADQGWFPNMSNLIANQKWIFGAVGVVSFFGLGMAYFFWRRRKARLAQYSSLPAGDEMSMSALLSGHRSAATPRSSRPTKELYDAFGEVSDEDDDGFDAPAGRGPVSRGIGFNSGFLDDDDDDEGGGAGPSGQYHDVVERSAPPIERARTPSPQDSSGDSWEHASS